MDKVDQEILENVAATFAAHANGMCRSLGTIAAAADNLGRIADALEEIAESLQSIDSNVEGIEASIDNMTATNTEDEACLRVMT